MRPTSPFKINAPAGAEAPVTPMRERSAFKSPKPSNKKQQTPPVAGKGGEDKHDTLVQDFWAVSPICSRLQDHINMITSTNFKENRFLSSPMPCQNQFMLNTPIMDCRFGSTAHTIKCQNSGSTSTHELTIDNTYHANRLMEEPA